MMPIEELEAELRAAMAERASHVPHGALAGLRAIDYRPRGRRLRPRLAIGAVASFAGATAATVALVSFGASAPEAFAGWTRSPSQPTRAQIASAERDCQSRLVGTPSAIAANAKPVLIDSRGPFSFVIYASENATATCIDGPQFTSVLGANGPGAGVAPAGEIRLISEHLTTRDGHPYSLVEGHVGAGVTATTLVLADGTKVTASLANGWFAAWWPGSHDVTATEITTGSGTRTETFPTSPAPPAGASIVGFAGGGTGGRARSGFTSISSARR